MKRYKCMAVLAAAGFLAVTPARAGDLDGIPGRYSDAVAAALRNWPPPELKDLKAAFERDNKSVALVCFQTPGDDLYIGAAQYQAIAAPFESVVRVLDDVPGYAGLFEDLLVSSVTSRGPGRLAIYTEQRIGVPFVPNEKNEMVYRISEQAAPRRKVYRYRLKRSNHLKFYDGMIVVEARGERGTDYTEYDLYDADWGLAKTLGHDKIWGDNLRGMVQADLAVRLKAEQPGRKSAEILKESRKAAGSVNVKACLKARQPWPPAKTAKE